jgi:hypothetical protein
LLTHNSNLMAHATLYGSFVSQKMPSFLLAGPASDRQNTIRPG